MVTKLKVKSCWYRLHPFFSECNLCKGIQQSKRHRLLSKRPLLKCPSCFLKDSKGNSLICCNVTCIQIISNQENSVQNQDEQKYQCGTWLAHILLFKERNKILQAVCEHSTRNGCVQQGNLLPQDKDWWESRRVLKIFLCNMSAGKKWGPALYFY